ncbi:uracil-DNA glycosylase [Phormidium yuhuli AB48]|uniref:Type-4 uracil-DNA glycosylase n=1 Tax=Phormidium yuhuli AB48 TaxID=2940671 RepID=A0ABY5ASU0_9CYAN|nr:uracil-DNA glycosylase [Phormidium yuhuli]USR91930.1 uracil-DNA glycosylase [Phormidium yuhuli AB48]
MSKHEQQLSLFGDSSPQPPAAARVEQIPTDASVPIAPGTYETLDPLNDHCQNCQRCGLASTRTQAVVSRGNPQAPVMIIGEGPGQQEDEQGLPFVGRSGELLENILTSVNFNTEKDVYICNVVKCRPPGNRNPNPQEIEACKPYLLEQIRLVNPRVILMTGAVAVKTLLQEKRGITKIRGQWFEWENRLCMPIFHPAYLLRNSSREKGKPKWLTWQDIQAVRAKVDELGAL